MHGDTAFVSGYVRQLLQNYRLRDQASLVIAAPFIYIPKLAELLQNSSITLAAQDISAYEKGAYTGDISAAMLADFRCSYSIIGHSERRTFFAEQDAVIAAKIKQALLHGIKPILCVGETEQDFKANKSQAVVQQQLDAVCADMKIKHMAEMTIAYEPVWAIGTGLTATPQQAQEMHHFIRDRVATYADRAVADRVKILYGGSVHPDNASALIVQQDVDGFLVGKASLDPHKLLALYNL